MDTYTLYTHLKKRWVRSGSRNSSFNLIK